MRQKELIRTICLLSIFCGTLSSTWTNAATIGRSITIDGDISDWSGIVDNPGQFSTDAEGTIDPADLDFPIQATGRDLRHFAYTYDSSALYFYVERYASTSNRNDWWFYLDTNTSGTMQDGEPVMRVSWQGSNGNTTRTLWDYDAVDNVNGDDIVNPSTGTADGYDMPGSITNSRSIGSTLSGGSGSGVEMETALPWSALGFGGPTSLGFHIASSNGANLPNQLNDNMQGPNGGAALRFGDISLTKTATPATVIAGQTASFILQVSNLSAQDDATDLVILDLLGAQGFSYISDDSSSTGTSYDSITGQWQIPLLSPGQNIILTLAVQQQTIVEETRINSATITEPGLIDTNSSNDGATTSISFNYGLGISKSAMTVSDPVTGTNFPKMIPGAYVDFFIDVENPSATSPTEVEIDDVLPSELALMVIDLPGLSQPFEFIDGGVSGSASGLTLVFNTLASTIDDIEFSNDNGLTFSYTPIADSSGVDASVTNLRFLLTGAFASSAGPPLPTFRLRLRAKIL